MSEKIVAPPGWIDIDGDEGKSTTYVRTSDIRLVHQQPDGAIRVQLADNCQVDLPNPSPETLADLMALIAETDNQ